MQITIGVTPVRLRVRLGSGEMHCQRIGICMKWKLISVPTISHRIIDIAKIFCGNFNNAQDNKNDCGCITEAPEIEKLPHSSIIHLVEFAKGCVDVWNC